MMDRVAVIGRHGQVAQHLASQLGPRAVVFGRPEIDLEKRGAALEIIDRQYEQTPWRALVIAAAYTQVDRAESERERAWAINAEAPGWIGRWASERQVRVIHYSTDYVYSGEGSLPHLESDPPAPVNAYGASKLAGDQSLQISGAAHVILRTSWVFSEFGGNFVKTILRLLQERERLTVVNDQVGAPTDALDLARAAVHLIDQTPSAHGLYHFTNLGETNWYDFACAIRDEAVAIGMEVKTTEIAAIPSSAYPTAAKRPLNSRLALERWRHDVPDFPLETWRQRLNRCVRALRGSARG